ncbi:MAG: sulfatase-like hydrolase/transferase [Armatimonadota bacterium]|nr:sulfatase-like hydrolase/transferase [Armatimonadota bacterium]
MVENIGGIGTVKLTRRQVLAGAAAGAAVVAAEGFADTVAGETMTKSNQPGRPNILIIKSDQHNARCLGVNGHNQVKTPNLDKLAGGGVNFTSAFVQNPICTPSRMCYLTGQYPHNHGEYGLSDGGGLFPNSLPSMFSEIKKLGYKTGIVGHIHIKDDWLQPHCDQYRNMHGKDNCYDKYLDAKGMLALRDDLSYKGHKQILDACASELSFEDSYEGYVMRSFNEFLDDIPADQPFFYQMDPLHPHENYIPTKEFWDMYEGVELELPPNADEDLASKTPNQKVTRDACRYAYTWVFEPKEYEAGRRRKLRGYYGCISQVDHLVGLARKKLREMGREENTIIVYCSDHGDFALEHGLLEKAPGISYDAILRVPFIWHWPAGGFAKGTVEELVESVDVFPTICSLLGINTPDTVDGLDISPMLKGDKKPLKDFIVAEFPLSKTIRTKEWKLCHRPRGMYKVKEDVGELYHVSEDLWEMKNLYADPKYSNIREELRRRLFDWIQLTTRYDNYYPFDFAKGKDGKKTVTHLKTLLDKENVNYL